MGFFSLTLIFIKSTSVGRKYWYRDHASPFWFGYAFNQSTVLHIIIPVGGRKQRHLIFQLEKVWHDRYHYLRQQTFWKISFAVCTEEAENSCMCPFILSSLCRPMHIKRLINYCAEHCQKSCPVTYSWKLYKVIQYLLLPYRIMLSY